MCITLGGFTAERGIIRLSGEARFGHAGALGNLHEHSNGSNPHFQSQLGSLWHGSVYSKKTLGIRFQQKLSGKSPPALLRNSDLLQNSCVQMSFFEFLRLLKCLTPSFFLLLLKVQVMLALTELCSKSQQIHHFEPYHHRWTSQTSLSTHTRYDHARDWITFCRN